MATEVNISIEKNPDLEGEVLVRALLLDSDGTVVRVLGSRTWDEDDLASQGHAKAREEAMAWATDLASKKEKEPQKKDVHTRK